MGCTQFWHDVGWESVANGRITRRASRRSYARRHCHDEARDQDVLASADTNRSLRARYTLATGRHAMPMRDLDGVGGHHR